MAGNVPSQFIDDLLSRADIVTVVDSRVPLKKAGREYVACCPFHSEKTPSFTVSTQKQFYHCFGCGAHGSAIGFLMEFDRLEFLEAVDELASMLGMPVPRDASVPVNQNKPLYQLLESAAEYFRKQLRQSPQSQRVIDYLKGRGISGEIAAQYGVGYAPPGWDNLLNHFSTSQFNTQSLLGAGLIIRKDEGGFYDRFRDRVMFPIRDSRGRVVAFGGRVLDDATPKYLNSPETKVFHKGQENYGLFEARSQSKSLESIIVVEGYMDVISLAQFGIYNVVATLGTATTQPHLEKLFRVVSNVVFCFDGDRAGKQAAWRALEVSLPVITDGRQIHFLFLPEGEDPDTYVREKGQAKFLQCAKEATPFSTFLFHSLSKNIDITEIDGCSILVDRARKLLNKLPQGIFRHMMYEKLAEITHMDAKKLSTLIAPQTILSQKVVKNKNHKVGMSPVRQAVKLLLEYPKLALGVEIQKFSDLKLTGVNVLEGLIGYINEHPNTTCGAILEYYRNNEHGAHLAKLAQIPLSVPESGADIEFKDIVGHLAKLRIQQRADQLLFKSKLGQLSEEEKDELKYVLSVK